MSGVFITGHAMIGLLVPIAAARAGVPPTGIGALMSAQFVLPFLLGIPIGGWLDRSKARTPMLISAALMVCVPWAAVAVPSVAGLLVVAVTAGLAQLTFVLAAQRLVASHGAGPAGERAFGWFSTFQSGGRMAGPLAAGVLVDLGGVAAGFAGSAAMYAAAMAGTLRTRRGPSPDRSHEVGTWRARARDQAGTLLANPGMRIALVVSCGVLMVHAVRQAFLPVYLESLAFSGTRIGMVMATVGLASMLVRPFVAQVVRVFGSRSRSLIATVGFVVAGTAAVTFLHGFGPLLAAMVVVGVGSGITQPLSLAVVSDHVPRRMLGFALGFRMTGNRAAQLVAPVALGLVAEAAGVHWVFVGAGALLLGGLPLLVRWRAPFEQDEGSLRQRRADADRATGGRAP
ncbi:MAG: MFS transporter [Trueperaceae bacterium]|nr:MFS transporter [Trueperaceae bacterium]